MTDLVSIEFFCQNQRDEVGAFYTVLCGTRNRIHSLFPTLITANNVYNCNEFSIIMQLSCLNCSV